MGKISKVISRLAGKNIYFDTNPIIYFLNQTEGYFELCLELFQGIEDGVFRAYSGDLSASA
jgi:predicted nucleic acid-binding protein